MKIVCKIFGHKYKDNDAMFLNSTPSEHLNITECQRCKFKVIGNRDFCIEYDNTLAHLIGIVIKKSKEKYASME